MVATVLALVAMATNNFGANRVVRERISVAMADARPVLYVPLVGIEVCQPAG